MTENASTKLGQLEQQIEDVSLVADNAVSELLRQLHRIASQCEAARTWESVERKRLAAELVDSQHELAHVRFDRDCLIEENKSLTERIQRPVIVLERTPGDLHGLAVKRQLEHAAHCLCNVDEFLVQCLTTYGVPHNQKFPAIKSLRHETGWSLVDCKKWVEKNYFQPGDE